MWTIFIHCQNLREEKTSQFEYSMFCQLFKTLQWTPTPLFQLLSHNLAAEGGGAGVALWVKVLLACGIVLQPEEFCANMQTFYHIFTLQQYSASQYSLVIEKSTLADNIWSIIHYWSQTKQERKRGYWLPAPQHYQFSIIFYPLSFFHYPLSVTDPRQSK